MKSIVLLVPPPVLDFLHLHALRAFFGGDTFQRAITNGRTTSGSVIFSNLEVAQQSHHKENSIGTPILKETIDELDYKGGKEKECNEKIEGFMQLLASLCH
ncbi:hypothetical protein MYX78_01095 [Acidobacteria bacterium AH-259-G07]|nr:hypothetical protein [Acidobacteria bacterium AH-259-G07]